MIAQDGPLFYRWVATYRGNSYSYDAVGNMSGRTVGGVYVAIAGQHYQYSGSTGTKHYYANGVRIAERVGGTLYWLLSDHLGSTAVTTNASGANVAELRYYAYGKPRYNVGGQKTDYRYTGQRANAQQNDLGIYWYNSRWYDQLTGRFLQPDTIVPNPGNPGSLNRYSYVLNNPLRYTDPTGFFSEEEIMNYLGVDTWEAVLAMFGEGGQFGGNWGWLEVLRQAKLGDSIAMWWSVGGIDAYNSPIAGVFSEDENGQLLFRGTFLGGNWVVSGMTLGQMQSSDGSDILYRVADRYIVNRKHYHLVFHKERVDWVDVGLDAVGAADTLGYAMMGAGMAAVTAGTGGIGLLLGGVVIAGLANAADMTAAGKAVADYQRGKSTGSELAVDLGLGVGGVVPAVGTYVDAASLMRNFRPGIYIGP